MGEEEESPDNDKLSCVGHESRGSMCHFVSQFFFIFIFKIYPWSQAFEDSSRLMPDSYKFMYWMSSCLL